MCGFADFRKGSCGSFPIFGKVYKDSWSDTPLRNTCSLTALVFHVKAILNDWEN